MNPKPLSALNHLTVPLLITLSLCRGEKCNSAFVITITKQNVNLVVRAHSALAKNVIGANDIAVRGNSHKR
jgi:hypothetical protein